MEPTSLTHSPFAVLTFIVAPALLTNSSSVLALSTSERHFGALGLGKSVPEILDSEDLEFFHRVAFMVSLALETPQPAGEGEPHTNLQPYLTLNFCVALQGVFPPRP